MASSFIVSSIIDRKLRVLAVQITLSPQGSVVGESTGVRENEADGIGVLVAVGLGVGVGVAVDVGVVVGLAV